ncbi:hypothetical protein BESB_048080 [Besnoitia besnoiti]|uniref:Transmembrane protein n=1 Tax=Besnoitia besnoiti TaxID=94643 RepID=A0A2A9MKT5_BESBE|nr:hypothetical protein BESB_048080 [Besnoitia besnoiti]PFH36616.1 hypothetical protein BESB_048080 [Besnoitia besnoiti]
MTPLQLCPRVPLCAVPSRRGPFFCTVFVVVAGLLPFASCDMLGNSGRLSLAPELGMPEVRLDSGIRPRRRLPSRLSSAAWMRLFADMRLTELALPATVHSTLTDVNNPRYTELAQAQTENVTRQLCDGIRVFDVRPWIDGKDGTWYTEVPWRFEEDLVTLRKAAAAPSHATDSSGAALPSSVQSLVDLHSSTALEASLFRPVQNFLRSNGNEVAVVVFSALNGNRHGSVSSANHASSFGHLLRRYAELYQPGASADPESLPKADQLFSPAVLQSQVGDGPSVTGTEHPAAFSVLSRSDTSASILSSAVRKPLFYQDVHELMRLVDEYWGQLLPRHEHVFYGPAESSEHPETPGSTAFPGVVGRSHRWRADSIDEFGHEYPMAESINRPDVFARWLQRQGEHWLSEAPLRELVASRVQLLLFVDDPLVAWFITAFSREHVMVFVAGDHVYDVSYKSEALLAPCGIPHRTGPIGDELSLTKERSWAQCRSKCESLSERRTATTARGPCTYWTFGPYLSPEDDTQAPDAVQQNSPTFDCRTFTGPLTVQSLAPLERAVTQPANCAASTLLEDSSQWNSVKLFSDLVDSVCPITGPGVSSLSLDVHQPFARELCLLDISGVYGSAATSERRSRQQKKPTGGVQEAKKLLRVHFAPAAPSYFMSGPRGGKRHFGAVDGVTPMNRLTLPWVLWHLERQQLLEGLTTGTGEKRDLPAGIARARGIRGGQVTRPVNALMLMRYDSLNNETRNDQPLNYFEIIMRLNPFPAGAAALALEGELGDFSSERYLHLTAFHSLPSDVDVVAFFSALDGSSQASKAPCMPMIWLVVCVAILCLCAMITACICGSSVCWKLPHPNGRGDWASAPGVPGQRAAPAVVPMNTIDSA